MLVLFETPAGYGLFKVKDEGKLKEADLSSFFEDPQKASTIIQLKSFSKFQDTTEALAAATALVESKLSPQLSEFLRKNVLQGKNKEKLAVADKILGSAIKKELGIKLAAGSLGSEVFRGIRSQLTNLVKQLDEDSVNAMTLGLSHSLSRYKLKFSPDKVDVMIVQAVGLLDDLDKELNTYAMRVREWYGWHFPELSKVVADNIVFAKLVRLIGHRINAAGTDMTDLVPEDVQTEIRSVAQISMGTEVSDEDVEHIKALCDQVIEIHEYRDELFSYLKNRMNAIAPNLSILVGELVGARLIAHAGSLMNLAKYPASTLQILGAEKALFRALKAKHETPKYGLIFHASLVGQAGVKNKGKISRVLAAKSALACRYDAFGEKMDTTCGLEGRATVEARLRSLEGVKKLAPSKSKPSVYDYNRSLENPSFVRTSSMYNPDADSTLGEKTVGDNAATKEESRKKRSRSKSTEGAANDEAKKKRKKRKTAQDSQTDETSKKRKKKRKPNETEEQKPEVDSKVQQDGVKKKPSKKSKSRDGEATRKSKRKHKKRE